MSDILQLIDPETGVKMIALLFALVTGVASAEAKDLDFRLEGYYRTRGYMFKELFAAPSRWRGD